MFDSNGNLLSLTDAWGHTTTYTYDSMNRVKTRTDPLSRQESFIYDLNGNLIKRTDRKNQVTSLSYDALNRPTLVGFNTVVTGGIDELREHHTHTSMMSRSRLTQLVDSAGGTITRDTTSWIV